MKTKTAVFASVALLPLCAWAQVQTPANQVPVGEGRLPTESTAPLQTRPGGDDCKRQSEAVRQQFTLQEQSLRREMADRSRQASESERERLRQETEQRLAALRAESVEAERKVLAACRG
jgi:hypothetical protein